MKNAVVIPALEPSEDLISYVDNLISHNIESIIVVNDGSSEAANYIFAQISTKKNCIVLTHTENMGKGVAIKTAVSYIRDYMKDIDGIITADADGQHSAYDVMRMNVALKGNKDKLVLGVRVFGENTPARSMMGNRISAKTLRLLYGIKLDDTQTGLRAVSRKYFDWLVSLPGNRYEYEINMLIYSKKIALQIHTITIETLYFDNNSGSHFRTVRDGGKVYLQMLKGLFQYIGNSCISATSDIVLFTVLFYLIQTMADGITATAIAASIARVASSFIDFRLNRSTFASKDTTTYKAYFKYYTLWVLQLCASIVLVTMFSSMFGVVQTVIKPAIDLGLGILSYQTQLHWVFKPEKKRVLLTKTTQMQIAGGK